jgi:hypothetical protein
VLITTVNKKGSFWGKDVYFFACLFITAPAIFQLHVPKRIIDDRAAKLDLCLALGVSAVRVLLRATLIMTWDFGLYAFNRRANTFVQQWDSNP